MTDREAIRTLAALVNRLAAGCWPNLGTTESNEIGKLSNEVFVAMLDKPKRSAAQRAARETEEA